MAEKYLPEFGRRTVRIVLSTVIAAVLATGNAAAQSSSTTCGDMPDQFRQLVTLLTRIQQLGVALALLIAVIMLIYAGILWMRGTPNSQQKARTIFTNTIIGLVIVLLAGGLVDFVKNILCGGA